jgi:hypothetical protein
MAHRIFGQRFIARKEPNTLAVAQSTINLSIPHAADQAQRIGLAGNLVARFSDVREQTQQIFDGLAAFKVAAEDIEKVFAAAYPEPAIPPRLRLLKNQLSEEQAKTFRETLDGDMLNQLVRDEESWERGKGRVRELREAAWEQFDAFEPSDLRGTAWAAYNAVTETSDWRGDGKTAGPIVGVRLAFEGKTACVCRSRRCGQTQLTDMPSFRLPAAELGPPAFFMDLQAVGSLPFCPLFGYPISRSCQKCLRSGENTMARIEVGDAPIEYLPLKSKRFLCAKCLAFLIEHTPKIKRGMGPVFAALVRERKRRGVPFMWKPRLECPNGCDLKVHSFHDMSLGKGRKFKPDSRGQELRKP